MNKHILLLFLFILSIIYPPLCASMNVSSSEIEEWRKLDKNENSAQAQYALGVSYFYGDGVEKNRNEAIMWFEKSARQGDAYAQGFLGSIYYWGVDPIKKDYENAFLWNEMAANNNDTNGQILLGLMYEKGLYVEQNHSKALYWLTKANESEYHSDAAKYYLGLMYINGNGVTKNYAKARHLFEEIDSDIQGLYVLAHMYINGIGGERNYEEARRLLEQVATSDEREIIVPMSLVSLILLMETKKAEPKSFSNTPIYAYSLLNYMLEPYPLIHEKINNIIIGK